MNKSIYLFYGEEDFLIEERIEALKSQIPNPLLNVETLEGGNLSQGALSTTLQTPPMFGGEKLIIIKNLEVSSANQEEFIPLMKSIPPGVMVVFSARAVDRRSKFYKLFEELGEVVEFKTFAPWELEELIGWIRARVRRGGKAITDSGAHLLQEICGNNLRLLAGEIEKLITFIGERDEIREGDVAVLASPGEKNAFALVDALREKNLKRALSLLHILLKNKEDLFQLLSLIASQYRLMLQIKSLPGREKDPGRIARVVGASPYFVKKSLEGIDNFTVGELKKNLEILLEANLKMKTGESQTIIFELLLTVLCGK